MTLLFMPFLSFANSFIDLKNGFYIFIITFSIKKYR